jgi:hypothetical protein
MFDRGIAGERGLPSDSEKDWLEMHCGSPPLAVGAVFLRFGCHLTLSPRFVGETIGDAADGR